VSKVLELPPAEQGHLERFFREHTGEPSLRLPPIVFVAGTTAAWLTRCLGASAVTFGCLVLVAPGVLARDGERLSAPAELIVHEAAHVLQYRAAGTLAFLASYAAGYLAALWRRGGLDAGARQSAYLDIPAERAARIAAAAYREWVGRDGGAGGRLSVSVRA
jgi:hypothetical protein